MKIKLTLIILLVLTVGLFLTLFSCTQKSDGEKEDENINTDSIPTDTPTEGEDESNEEPSINEPVVVSALPDGWEFVRAKSKTALVPKTVRITECYFWQENYYYFTEVNDDNDDRLYYKIDINHIEDGKDSFVIGIGSYELYAIFDRSAINEYGYGFEPAGSELVILKTVSTDQHFEWNGNWYYFYEDTGFEVRFVKSSTPYHLEGMELFWLKGRVEYYRFVQI